MPRHEFQPGKLVAGLAFALAGVTFAGDAGGLWETPWFAIIPIVIGGLCLAGATTAITQTIRRNTHPPHSPPPPHPNPTDHQGHLGHQGRHQGHPRY
ncbi:hypothetical protein ACIO13_32225 [Streptomyces sp. NPDC087425]|uniref:hypothetical protein n=1 Tax=Streptomyces sp. NPDC087425 TaxID=3365787 RepID=UPI00380A4D3C